MRDSVKHGFTLIELLVVVSIIGMLISLLLPAVNSARSAGRNIQCRDNLHNQGFAYLALCEASRQQTLTMMDPYQWPTTFSAYEESQTRVFVCPEDKEAPVLAPLSSYTYYSINNNLRVPINPGQGTFCWLAPLSTPPQASDFSGMAISQLPTPESYVILLEDLALSTPWDTAILVTPQSDGTVQVTNIEVHAGAHAYGYTHQLLDPQNQVKFTPFVQGNQWSVSAPMKTSYGINNRAPGFLKDSNKILLAEYYGPVAYVVGATTGTDLTNTTQEMTNSMFWGRWGGSRARHNGTMNVLYADGNVRSVTPDSVNPANPDIHDTLWKPLRDPGLSPIQ